MSVIQVDTAVPTVKTPDPDLLRKTAGHVFVRIASATGGVIRGEFQSLYLGGWAPFSGLDHLVMLLDAQMEEADFPQSSLATRRICDAKPKSELLKTAPAAFPEGSPGAALVELRVLFRQHGSMQGQLIYRKQTVSFRSALELMWMLRDICTHDLQSQAGEDASPD